jgi:hypothetical protein
MVTLISSTDGRKYFLTERNETLIKEVLTDRYPLTEVFKIRSQGHEVDQLQLSDIFVVNKK